jgi:hypothetical protein
LLTELKTNKTKLSLMQFNEKPTDFEEVEEADDDESTYVEQLQSEIA